MLINNNEYFGVLDKIKSSIKEAQYRAVLGANCEQIMLNWNIGKVIIENSKWGNKFIDNLARDIKLDLPNTKGYSVRNLKYMRKFAEFVSDAEIVQTLSAQLTWSHNTHLFDKTKTIEEYLWYATQTLENGWSLSSLKYHRDKLTAEYALKDINKPIGVSEYKLSDFVPAELVDTLPSAEDIEKRIKMELDVNDGD